MLLLLLLLVLVLVLLLVSVRRWTLCQLAAVTQPSKARGCKAQWMMPPLPLPPRLLGAMRPAWEAARQLPSRTYGRR